MAIDDRSNTQHPTRPARKSQGFGQNWNWLPNQRPAAAAIHACGEWRWLGWHLGLFCRCQAVDSSCFFLEASNIGEHRGCKFQNMEMQLRNSWNSLLAGNSRARIEWNNQIWYQPAHHPIDIPFGCFSKFAPLFFMCFSYSRGGNTNIDVKLKWAPAGPPFLSHYLRMIFKDPQKVTFRLTTCRKVSISGLTTWRTMVCLNG